MVFATVQNYYEQMVYLRIQELLTVEDAPFREDVACVALNQLPPRYVRESVDLLFYMSPNERARMVRNVEEAVVSAIDFVRTRQRRTEGWDGPNPAFLPRSNH